MLAVQQQVGLDQLLALQVELLPLQRQLQRLARAHLGQGVLHPGQHPTELTKLGPQNGQPLSQRFLDLACGSCQR